MPFWLLFAVVFLCMPVFCVQCNTCIPIYVYNVTLKVEMFFIKVVLKACRSACVLEFFWQGLKKGHLPLKVLMCSFWGHTSNWKLLFYIMFSSPTFMNRMCCFRCCFLWYMNFGECLEEKEGNCILQCLQTDEWWRASFFSPWMGLLWNTVKNYQKNGRKQSM